MSEHETQEVRLRALIAATAEEARRAPPEPEPRREDAATGVSATPDVELQWYASVRLAQALGLVAIVALVLQLFPGSGDDPADVPVARGLGIAAYHVVHRIEAARQRTGKLPAAAAPEWTAGTGVRYEPAGDLYRVRVQRDGLELVYVPGTDPEVLLSAPLRLTTEIGGESDDG